MSRLNDIPDPHIADPDKAWEVHFKLNGEFFADAYDSEPAMKRRFKELIEEEHLDVRGVTMHHVVRTPVKRSIQDIVTGVRLKHNLTLREIRKPTKNRKVIAARREAAYLCSREGWADCETAPALNLGREAVAYNVRQAIALGEEPILGRAQNGKRMVRLNTTPGERMREKRKAAFAEHLALVGEETSPGWRLVDFGVSQMDGTDFQVLQQAGRKTLDLLRSGEIVSRLHRSRQAAELLGTKLSTLEMSAFQRLPQSL